MSKTVTTYEVVIEKTERFKVFINAESESEAIELAFEKERRGDAECSSVLDAKCVAIAEHGKGCSTAVQIPPDL